MIIALERLLHSISEGSRVAVVAYRFLEYLFLKTYSTMMLQWIGEGFSNVSFLFSYLFIFFLESALSQNNQQLFEK